jgi:undecaprenyl-diphosphatase
VSRGEEVARVPYRGAIVALTIAFVAFAAIAKLAPDNGIDRDIALVVRSTDALDALWRAISWLGLMPWSVVVPVTAFGVLLFVSRGDAFGLAIAVIGAETLTELIRLVVDRIRPDDQARHLQTGWISGFPSGHVTLYVALFGALAFAARRQIRSRAPRVAATAACVAIIALVGPSRVYLGAHWPSDVAGSYALAGAWLLVAMHLGRTLAASGAA